MKNIITILAVVAALNFSANAEETTSEKLAAAKTKQVELQKEIERLQNPSAKDQGKDMLILVKRQYNEAATKVAALTKEIVEKINKKGDK